MQIPGTCKIGNLTYRLDWLPEETAEKSYAVSNRVKQFVKFARENTTEQMEESFFHELVHQLLVEFHWYQLSDDEKLVQSLAVGLYQVMRDNGCLTQPLFEDPS